MRYVLAAVVVVVGVSLMAAAGDDDKYKSKEGKFAVQFPTGAKVDVKKHMTNGTEVQLVHSEQNGQIHMATHMDLPAELVKMGAKAIFDQSEAAGATKVDGKVESTQEFTFGKEKLPGREFVVALKSGTTIRTRFILDGSRVYGVQVIGSKDFTQSKEATKFLNSFESTK